MHRRPASIHPPRAISRAAHAPRLLLALVLALLLGGAQGAGPASGPTTAAAAPTGPAAAQDRVWVVEQIELRTGWAGLEGDGAIEHIPDRSLFELSKTVTNGPREIQGSIEMLVEHPAWVAPGEPFEMSAEAIGLLDSSGSFGASTPTASLQVKVHCGTTVPRGGRCGDASQEAGAFDSVPNAQNRSISLSGTAAFPAGSWEAPPAPGTVDAWTVRFSSELVLSSNAIFTISGTIWYRYSARPAAPPTFDLSGRALGRPEIGSFCPLNGARVELLEAGRVIDTTRALEPDGRFLFRDAPRVADLSLRVTLEQLNEDLSAPGGFRVTYRDRHPAGAVPFVETRPFDGRVQPQPGIQNVIFDDLFPLKPDPPGRVLPNRVQRAAVAVIYCHTWEAWKLSELLSQPLDLAPPVDIVAYARGDVLRWVGPDTVNPAIPDAWIEIGREKGYSEILDGDRPDNREWHEFGHQVMADTLSDLMPEDPRPCPAGRPPGFDCKHLGSLNARSTDSWVEGFAEFYSVMVAAHVLREERPELYRLQGVDVNLEANYLAADLPIQVRPGDDDLADLEELAVAGLLLDLVDPPNAKDLTLYSPPTAPAGVTPEPQRLDFADCVQMDLHPHLWEIVAGDWGELHPTSPDAPAGYGHLFDVKQLYDVLAGEGYGQDRSRGLSLTDLDELFVAHGFFVDQDEDGLWDEGEEIGRSAASSRPGGAERRRPSWPDYARLLGRGRDEETGRALPIARYRVAMRFDPPFEALGYESTVSAGAEGALPLVGAPAQYPARFEITAYADGGYRSTAPLLLEGEAYWRLMREAPGDELLRHEFPMERGEVLYLPVALRPEVDPAVLLAASGTAAGAHHAGSGDGAAARSAGARTGPRPLDGLNAEAFAPRRQGDVEACVPVTPSPTPSPEPSPSVDRPVPVRVDPDHVFEGLDARLTVAGHFFDEASRVQVGERELEDLEDLGPDPEPPHYHRLRGLLPAGLEPGVHDLSVTARGRVGTLREGFAVLEPGQPTPPPDPQLQVLSVTAAELGLPGPRSAFLASDPVRVDTRVVHHRPETAPAVLLLEIHGPEGRGGRVFLERRDIELPPGDEIGLDSTLILPRDLEAGEYTLSATVKAYGKQVEAKSQLVVADALAMRDSFDSASSGWPLGRDGGLVSAIEGGELRVAIDGPPLLRALWREPWRRLDGLAVELDARRVRDEPGLPGVALDVSQDGGRGLWMLTDGSGRLRLTRQLGDLQATPLGWTYTPALRQGEESNHLMALRRGREWKVYANGTLLRRLVLDEDGVAPGWAGLVAAALAEPAEMRFDNVRVFELRE